MASLSFTAAGQANSKPRPVCNWDNVDTGAEGDVQFATDGTEGLKAVYDGRSATNFFEPSTIQGYPAVTFRRTTDQGDCSVAVAVTNQLYYQADVLDLPSGDPCSAAKTIATAAMTTIKSST